MSAPVQDTLAMQRRRQWSRHMIDRAMGETPPRFGTREWLALPDGPLKVAAVVIAAECWARDADVLLENLQVEIERGAERGAKLDEDEQWALDRASWRDEWGDKSYRPHPANRRRA